MPDAITGEFLGTGRRKRATARVRIKPGSGKIVVNRRTVEHYFPIEEHRMIINGPFIASENSEKFDVRVNVQGGGITGQANASLPEYLSLLLYRQSLRYSFFLFLSY